MTSINMPAIPRFVHAVTSRVKALGERRRIAAYYTSSYESRVASIKEIYSHPDRASDAEKYFAGESELEAEPQPFYDLIRSYAELLQPIAILQAGCLTAAELRWLIRHGCPARMIASDYDADRLSALKERFRGTPDERIEFLPLDLETVTTANLEGKSFVVCNAVLSNIQPEGVERFVAAAADAKVQILIISDVYSKQSLTTRVKFASSAPSSIDLNWFHPYLALGAKHGFQGLFFPDFTSTSFVSAHGVFILYRYMDIETHAQAAAVAMGRYVARQPKILLALDDSLEFPEKHTERP